MIGAAIILVAIIALATLSIRNFLELSGIVFWAIVVFVIATRH